MLNNRIKDIQIPQRMRSLPISDEGYPIPYFVPWITDAEGRRYPEFRAMDTEKFFHAIRHKRCWLCGNPLGKYLCFPIGPMCAITRTSAEPPSHLECAEYGARACPFLTQPRMRRNEMDLPEGRGVAGLAIERNPGCVVIWSTLSYKTFKPPGGGIFFEIGEPITASAWSQGRQATIEEMIQSIRTGYPLLETIAKRDGHEEELRDKLVIALKVLGIESMYLPEKVI